MPERRISVGLNLDRIGEAQSQCRQSGCFPLKGSRYMAGWRVGVDSGGTFTDVCMVNETTGEVKYFLSNAAAAGLARILRVAFTRWNVEHLFRVAKQEVGLMHYEGRDYTGLMRHLILGLIVMGFVSQEATRQREKKPGDHAGANLPSPERPLPPPPASPPRDTRNSACQPSDPIPSAA